MRSVAFPVGKDRGRLSTILGAVGVPIVYRKVKLGHDPASAAAMAR
jgi:hypothetical protein